MVRSLPSTSYQTPGNLVLAEIWNNGPKAMNDFLSNRPAFVGMQQLVTNVLNNAWTAIRMDTTFLDTDGGHNTVTNNTRYTAQVAGWYWVQGMTAWNTGTLSGGPFRIDNAIAKNGSPWVGSSQFLSIAVQGPSSASCSALIQLAAGDYLEVWGRQLTGATQSFDNGSQTDGTTNTGFCEMNALWVHS